MEREQMKHTPGPLQELADRALKGLDAKVDTWETVRDHCDILSAGELDTFQLDMVTDMVMKRLGAQ